MYTVGFNKEWVKSVSKAEFLEHEKHHEANGIDLSAEYDKIVPPKAKEKPTQKVESADEK